jgi:hypothetical protein
MADQPNVYGSPQPAPAEKPPDAVSTTRAQIAELEKQKLKLDQEINRLTAIPRSSTGETQNLGNAPTPDPIEPNVNEPGNVIYQNPPDPAASVPSTPPKVAVTDA